MDDNRKRFPFPEALPGKRGGKWDIKERAVSGKIGGLCSPALREMAVPLGPTPQERNIRKHELLHAAFSPGVVPIDPAAHPDFVQVAEDARIQCIGLHAGVTWADGGFDLPDLRKTLVERACSSKALDEDHLRMILILVARWGTPDFDTWINGIRAKRAPKMKQIAGQVSRLLYEHLPRHYVKAAHNPESAIDLAKALTTLFLPEAQPQPEPKSASLPSSLTPGTGQKQTPAEKIEHKKELQKATRKAESNNIPSRTGRKREKPELPLWGKMLIERPLLSKPLRARIKSVDKSVDWRPATEGSGVRYPHRWAVDRAIFASKRSRVGGTVVIDASGSMSLEPADLLKILISAPAATVACYSGTFTGPHKATGGHGVLRILALRGRRVADRFVAQPCEGQNCIDGPMLQWLGTQKGPRLWISDGLVVGAGGDRSEVHVADAQRLQKAGRIIRIPKPNLAGDILAFIHKRWGK
jgi:hypothetical protein